MPKITFMGAGSTVFARNVLGDCMCSPALCESEIALYDIDPGRLADSEIILNAINKNVNDGRAVASHFSACSLQGRTQCSFNAGFFLRRDRTTSAA